MMRSLASTSTEDSKALFIQHRLLLDVVAMAQLMRTLETSRMSSGMRLELVKRCKVMDRNVLGNSKHEVQENQSAHLIHGKIQYPVGTDLQDQELRSMREERSTGTDAALGTTTS
jgi:hypothetical protein